MNEQSLEQFTFKDGNVHKNIQWMKCIFSIFPILKWNQIKLTFYRAAERERERGGEEKFLPNFVDFFNL